MRKKFSSICLPFQVLILTGLKQPLQRAVLSGCPDKINHPFFGISPYCSHLHWALISFLYLSSCDSPFPPSNVFPLPIFPECHRFFPSLSQISCLMWWFQIIHSILMYSISKLLLLSYLMSQKQRIMVHFLALISNFIMLPDRNQKEVSIFLF